jgi:hypothetical protein
MDGGKLWRKIKQDGWKQHGHGMDADSKVDARTQGGCKVDTRLAQDGQDAWWNLVLDST